VLVIDSCGVDADHSASCADGSRWTSGVGDAVVEKRFGGRVLWRQESC
jgi:hypothetical protein